MRVHIIQFEINKLALICHVMHIKTFLSINAIFLCVLYDDTCKPSKNTSNNNVNSVAISHL